MASPYKQMLSCAVQAVSIVFFTESWRPDSFYDRILSNRKAGLHTLCLLDIKVKEPSMEALCRGRKEYEPARYMTINTAIEQLLEVEGIRQEGAYGESTLCVGVARLGSDEQRIVAGNMKDLLTVQFGPPLHSLVIAGDMHVIEEELVAQYRLAG
jgi:diphthine methyl ester synthase